MTILEALQQVTLSIKNWASQKINEVKVEKLSDLENDLYYNNAEEIITLYPSDFTAVTEGDECFGYQCVLPHQFDWYVYGGDHIGFAINYWDGVEQMCHGVSATDVAEYSERHDSEMLEYYSAAQNECRTLECQACGVRIINGYDYVADEFGDLVDITLFNTNPPTFSSLVIYRIKRKQIARECIEISDVEDNLKQLRDNVSMIQQRISYVESKNTPKRTTITLPAASWTGSSNPWSQVVTITGVHSRNKIDLQPTAAQIVDMQNNEIALMAENNNGTVTVYAIGNKPTADYTIQVLITEVTTL